MMTGHREQSAIVAEPIQLPIVSRRRREYDENTRPPAHHIARKPFIKEFADNYHAGQHATFLGPTGRGKTKLMGQLLVAVLRRHPEMEGRVLHGKIRGRDQTIEELSKQGFPITTEPELSRLARLKYRARSKGNKKPLGFIVRPLTHPEGYSDDKVSFTQRENNHLRRVFARAIYKAYHAKKKRPVILVVDEAHQAHVDLKLKSECEGPLMRGRPVCAEWSALQRGRYASQHLYDQAEHVFIFFDPVKDNQDRYAEIGGIDPDYLKELSRNLTTETVADGSTISQCIYFRRSGNYLAIVDT